jgi:hypothetical protein
MAQSVVQAFFTFSIQVAGGITRQKNKLKAMVCQGENIIPFRFQRITRRQGGGSAGVLYIR